MPKSRSQDSASRKTVRCLSQIDEFAHDRIARLEKPGDIKGKWYANFDGGRLSDEAEEILKKVISEVLRALAAACRKPDRSSSSPVRIALSCGPKPLWPAFVRSTDLFEFHLSEHRKDAEEQRNIPPREQRNIQTKIEKVAAAFRENLRPEDLWFRASAVLWAAQDLWTNLKELKAIAGNFTIAAAFSLELDSVHVKEKSGKQPTDTSVPGSEKEKQSPPPIQLDEVVAPKEIPHLQERMKRAVAPYQTALDKASGPFQREIESRMQEFLGCLAERRGTSPEESKQIAGMVNDLAENSGIDLTYNGQIVHLRWSAGVFEARTMGSSKDRETLTASATFPRLTARAKALGVATARQR